MYSSTGVLDLAEGRMDTGLARRSGWSVPPSSRQRSSVRVSGEKLTCCSNLLSGTGIDGKGQKEGELCNSGGSD
eukprot:2643281-Rhodomonas_salina.1